MYTSYIIAYLNVQLISITPITLRSCSYSIDSNYFHSPISNVFPPPPFLFHGSPSLFFNRSSYDMRAINANAKRMAKVPDPFTIAVTLRYY